MQRLFVLTYKVLKFAIAMILKPIDWLRTFFLLYSNGAKFRNFKSYGVPKINVSFAGKVTVGKNFIMNNRESSNPIGRFNACSLFVDTKGELIIGDNVGISSTSIVCSKHIKIGDNVKIGGNVVIYDTDFHSLDASDRMNPVLDKKNKISKSVIIGNHVFIGSHSTILKGVNIGDNAVVGACSLVTKDIPANEVWGGNPARVLKKLN